MRVFLRGIPFLAFLLLSFNAAAFTNETMTCPSLSSIQAEGVNDAEMVSEQPLGFVAYSVGTYETNAFWGFFIGPFLTSTDSEAVAKGQAMLSQMSGEGEVVEVEGIKVCKYETGDQFVEAYAAKMEFGISHPRLMSLFKK